MSQRVALRLSSTPTFALPPSQGKRHGDEPQTRLHALTNDQLRGTHALLTCGMLHGPETMAQLDNTATGTCVTEHHRMALPDSWCLRGWVREAWVQQREQIWEGDLAVRVCRGGWPGVLGTDGHREPEATPYHTNAVRSLPAPLFAARGSPLCGKC